VLVVVKEKRNYAPRYMAMCPFCGDHSDPVRIEGSIIIEVTDHVISDGIEYGDDDLLILKTACQEVAP
jgi:hypothetical protein